MSYSEIMLLLNEKASLIHCPTANGYLKSGIMPARIYLDKGINVGIGSDIAAGYNFSVLNEMNEALLSAAVLADISDNKKNELSATDVFRMGTINNSEILRINEYTGSLEAGKDADFLVIENKYHLTDSEELLKRIIEDRNRKIEAVFVRGKNLFNPT